MSDFKAKIHQNPKFGWGSNPDPARGAYSASTDPLAGFGGRFMAGRGWAGKRRGRRGRGKWREGK